MEELIIWFCLLAVIIGPLVYMVLLAWIIPIMGPFIYIVGSSHESILLHHFWPDEPCIYR